MTSPLRLRHLLETPTTPGIAATAVGRAAVFMVETADGFRSQAPTLEAAALNLTHQLQRAADQGRPLDWAVTTPQGDCLSAAPDPHHANGVVAVTDEMRAKLIRYHLDTTRILAG